MQKRETTMQKLIELEPVELNDAELAAVAGGQVSITNSFTNSFNNSAIGNTSVSISNSLNSTNSNVDVDISVG